MSSKRFPLALFTFALLAGCAQNPPAPKVEPQAMLQFQNAFQSAVYRSITTHVQEETVGALSLRIVVDRQGRALSCETAPASVELMEQLPPDMQLTERARFAEQMLQACRQGIYPTAPAALYDDKGQIEVLAPVHVVFPNRKGARWKVLNAQRQFFADNLLKGERIDSVGLLVVRYQRDAGGCLVDLRPHNLRPADFKLDGALQGRLNAACMKLDLRQVPGIELLDESKPVGLVSMEYAPWTVGR